MSKLIFRPISILAGLLAGVTGKKLFRGVWRVVDEDEPPKPEQRLAPIALLALALAIEGALFRLVRGLAEHGSRRAFSRLTGKWPGERAESSDRVGEKDETCMSMRPPRGRTMGR